MSGSIVTIDKENPSNASGTVQFGNVSLPGASGQFARWPDPFARPTPAGFLASVPGGLPTVAAGAVLVGVVLARLVR